MLKIFDGFDKYNEWSYEIRCIQHGNTLTPPEYDYFCVRKVKKIEEEKNEKNE